MLFYPKCSRALDSRVLDAFHPKFLFHKQKPNRFISFFVQQNSFNAQFHHRSGYPIKRWPPVCTAKCAWTAMSRPTRLRWSCGWTVAANRCPNTAARRTNWKFSYERSNTKRIFVSPFATWIITTSACTNASRRIRSESSRRSCTYKVNGEFLEFFTSILLLQLFKKKFDFFF